jgi:hypothetical protein
MPIIMVKETPGSLLVKVDLIGFQPKICGKYPLNLNQLSPILKLDRRVQILTLDTGGKFPATEIHEYIVIFLVFSLRQKVEKMSR